MGNDGASGNMSSLVESSNRLNELTEEALKIEVGSLFQNSMTRFWKDAFLRVR